MQRLDRVGLQHLPGMDEKRLDLILAGALVLEEACLALGASRVRATEATLRDGLLRAELATVPSKTSQQGGPLEPLA
jgi:exopolyphosphatase/pppGpp-phosphohydrolase